MITADGYDNTARVWDANSGALISCLKGHRKFVGHAVFGPDGKTAVTASDDKNAILWDAVDGKAMFNMDHAEELDKALISPDGTRLLALPKRGGQFSVWDPGSAQISFLRWLPAAPCSQRFFRASTDIKKRL